MKKVLFVLFISSFSMTFTFLSSSCERYIVSLIGDGGGNKEIAKCMCEGRNRRELEEMGEKIFDKKLQDCRREYMKSLSCELYMLETTQELIKKSPEKYSNDSRDLKDFVKCFCSDSYFKYLDGRDIYLKELRLDTDYFYKKAECSVYIDKNY